jgi:hypothetical protein
LKNNKEQLLHVGTTSKNKKKMNTFETRCREAIQHVDESLQDVIPDPNARWMLAVETVLDVLAPDRKKWPVPTTTTTTTTNEVSAAVKWSWAIRQEVTRLQQEEGLTPSFALMFLEKRLERSDVSCLPKLTLTSLGLDHGHDVNHHSSNNQHQYRDHKRTRLFTSTKLGDDHDLISLIATNHSNLVSSSADFATATATTTTTTTSPNNFYYGNTTNINNNPRKRSLQAQANTSSPNIDQLFGDDKRQMLDE